MKADSLALKGRRTTVVLRLVGILFFTFAALCFGEALGLRHAQGAGPGQAGTPGSKTLGFELSLNWLTEETVRRAAALPGAPAKKPKDGTIDQLAKETLHGISPVTKDPAGRAYALSCLLAGLACLAVGVLFSLVRPARPNLDGYDLFSAKTRFSWWTGDPR